MENDSSSPGGAGAALGRWWGQSPQPSPSTDVMNQLCRVCGEPAAGFHFGAFTCEGCKSFFGRTYNNLGSITECKNNGECVINKKNRTACKACRLRKCLLVGMSKSGSRYGRRSNWFKIHCLLQEQQQAAGTGTHLKDKSPLAIWGESYKNLTTPTHFDSDSKGSPTEDTIPLNNNNNNLTKDRDRSPNPILSSTAYPAEAAAALWAARHSLFPMHLPHHHIPPIPMPFIPSFPNFPPPGHPHSQSNILLPFIHNLHSPSPHSNHIHPNPSTSPSASPSICSPSPSPSPSTSPPRNHQTNSSPDSDPPHPHKPSRDKVPVTLTLPNHRSKDTHHPDRRTALGNNMAEEHSLALLRSLGPMQDTPMDLSVRVIQLKHRRKRRRSERAKEEGEGEGECEGEGEEEGIGEREGSESGGSDSEVMGVEVKDGVSESLETNDENFNKRKTPLDLTKSTKMEM